MSIKIKRWVRSGELNNSHTTSEEVLDECGHVLDHNGACDILGDVLFEGEDGKYYVITVEAVISEAKPEYVKDILSEDEENK